MLKNISYFLISSYEIFKDNFFGVGFDKYKLYVDNEIFKFRHSLTPKLNNQDASQNFSISVFEYSLPEKTCLSLVFLKITAPAPIIHFYQS